MQRTEKVRRSQQGKIAGVRANTSPDAVTQSIQLALGGPWGHIKLLLITVAHDGSINVDVERSMLSSAKTTTALRWISPSQLAVGRVGEVVLWTPSSSRNLQIPIETFNGWTSIANPLDIWAVDRTDQLVVALADGTFRTISNPWTTPMVDPLHSDETSDNPTSLQLCEQVRKSFLAVERASVKLKSTGTITAGAAMIVSGCVALDSSGTFFMAYERHNLDARVYSMATLHKSALLFGRMFESDGPDVELLLSNVRAVLTNPKPGEHAGILPRWPALYADNPPSLCQASHTLRRAPSSPSSSASGTFTRTETWARACLTFLRPQSISAMRRPLQCRDLATTRRSSFPTRSSMPFV
jgi:hypothetical protein